jgi:UDP-glucose 4-epimerase
MKKFIVVTGGAGFIGSNLIELLLKKTKSKIISYDNYSTGKKNNHINNKRVVYLKGHTSDISKKLHSIKDSISDIFHFGEFSRLNQSFNEYYKCFDSNILGSLNVINFCLKNKIKIIYSATSASLGNNQYDQHLSPYAFSKATNMNLIMNYNQWYGLKYEIIYFYNVYGPKQILNSNMAAVVGIFESCYKKNKPMPVVSPGTQTRRFTHITDTVEICYFAWKKNKNSHYSISSKKSYSILALAKMFSAKRIFLKKERGERFKSTTITKIRGKKIINLYSKKDIKEYIKEFKLNHQYKKNNI